MYNFDPYNVLLAVATNIPSDLSLLLCSRVTYASNMHANKQLVTFEKWSLTVPYCTPFWDFNLGGDVLKNIFLQYMYQKPS